MRLLRVELPRAEARWLRKVAREQGLTAGEMLARIIHQELEKRGCKPMVNSKIHGRTLRRHPAEGFTGQ
jgi:hypothetical protein